MSKNIILNITDSDFENKILNVRRDQNNILFLVDFWAEWCNPCKILSSVLEDVSVEFEEKSLIIAKLNIDKNPITVKNYSIRSVPTLLLFRKGVVISRKIGVLSKQQLKSFIEEYLLEHK